MKKGIWIVLLCDVGCWVWVCWFIFMVVRLFLVCRMVFGNELYIGYLVELRFCYKYCLEVFDRFW